MTIDLLPHNQMLYDKIVAEISTGVKSIFYSEGTGLGKSYIFMALVQNQFRGKRVLYIVPKIAIFNNLEHYEEFQSLEADITYTTFAAFNTYEENDPRVDSCDVVFVDECHHMLSDIQGVNVYKFMRDVLARDKYCFGMTATPCYKGIFVDEEYFDVSCYGYDVFEAIGKGLMPKIDVALANIDVSEIPDDMKASFSISGTKVLLDSIIEKYSHVTHWLAYFATKKDLESNVAEMRKLFPEFTILKLYQGTSNPDKIIKDFEKSDGKVVLMSVSMLLEGVHLGNVGGVLLYRNVTRNSTYFQIYGRLCALHAKHSPVLVDVTNSAIHLTDFPIFKSSRCAKRRSYTRRDIFDTHTYGYRLLELQDLAEQFKIKEYRGIRWTSVTTLGASLGVRYTSVTSMLKNGKTVQEYIDSRLKDSTYEEYVLNGYKGFFKSGDYEYENYAQLADMLGVSCTYNKYLGNHPNATVDEYINRMSLPKNSIRRFYKGIEITSYGTAARDMNIKRGTMWAYCNRCGYTLKDYVDFYIENRSKSTYRGKAYYRGVDVTCAGAVVEHFDLKRSTVYAYLRRKNISLEQFVDLRLDHPEMFK